MKKYFFLFHVLGGAFVLLSFLFEDKPEWKVIVLGMAMLSILIGWERTLDCPIGILSSILLFSITLGNTTTIGSCAIALIAFGLFKVIFGK